MLSIIVARSENNVIGRRGRIPWRIKGEQLQFKQLTEGNAVIMGRKSYEEIGHPLPGRLNIVVSRTRNYTGENLMTVGSLAEAVEAAKSRGALQAADSRRLDKAPDGSNPADSRGALQAADSRRIDKAPDGRGTPGGREASKEADGSGEIKAAADGLEIFVAGGAGLFAEALPMADTLYITEVHLTVEDGDTFFPAFDPADFVLEIGETQTGVLSDNEGRPEETGREVSFTRTIYRRRDTANHIPAKE